MMPLGRWSRSAESRPVSPVVLHDLEHDIAETTDVAAEHPDLAATTKSR
jgi:hypothetical protein